MRRHEASESVCNGKSAMRRAESKTPKSRSGRANNFLIKSSQQNKTENCLFGLFFCSYVAQKFAEEEDGCGMKCNKGDQIAGDTDEKSLLPLSVEMGFAQFLQCFELLYLLHSQSR